MTEARFLTEILDGSDALRRLDIANVHANTRNRRQNLTVLLDALPLVRVAYVHVARGAERDGVPAGTCPDRGSGAPRDGAPGSVCRHHVATMPT